MKITADTNVLLRAAVRDDASQARSAANALRQADLIAVSVSALCEFVWVMRTAYKRPAPDVAKSIHSLLRSGKVVMDRPSVEAGLAVLEAGGDFADGAIAHDGARLGADEFLSFDKQAVSLLKSKGVRARLLS